MFESAADSLDCTRRTGRTLNYPGFPAMLVGEDVAGDF
jgi:hypothetical protein